jgi:hypothetical protein
VVNLPTAGDCKRKVIFYGPDGRETKKWQVSEFDVVYAELVTDPNGQSYFTHYLKELIHSSYPKQFAATLPNGVTVELVGVCEYPSAGKQWWRPDGTPFTLPAGIRVEDSIRKAGVGDNAYQFLFRYNSQEDLTWNSLDAVCLHFAIEGHSGTNLINMKRLPKGGQDGLVAKVAIFKEPLDSTTIQANLATGNWQTQAVRDISKIDQRNEDLYWFTSKTPSTGNVSLDILHRIEGQQIKTIAIDREGNEYGASYSLGSFNGWASISSIDGRRYVAGLRKDDRLVKFKLQSRPFWSSVIGNVSLKPNLKTDVQVEVKSLEFGAVDFKVILPNDVAVELQPGKLVFHGRYQHRSRGQDIEMPSELWIKQNVEGGLKALAYLPWRGSYDLASGDMNHRLESYRSGCDSAVGRTAYSIHLEFGDDKASLTRRGIRQNHNKTELAIPKGASFNPNSRPDSYCADNILLRGLDLSPGQIKELRVYDWDNSGEKLVDYSIHISHAGKELIKVPAGTFEANHLVLKQVTSADTWFKKRAGHITDFWVLDNHIIVRVVRHREPYEMELLEYTYPKDLGGKTEGQKTNVGPGMPHTDSKEKANEAQRRIDAAKWSEGKAMLGTIATAIRAWVAEKSPDGSWDSNSLTFADLGFIKGDLTGTYFDESNFSWIITYNKNIGKLSYTIRATAGKGMKYPSVVTLNQDGQFTQEPHQQTENPAVQVEGKKTADNLNIDESKISPPGRICTL